MKIITKTYAFFLITAFAFVSCHKNNNPAPNVLQTPTANWTRINAVPNENITALEIVNDVIYAASSTSQRVFISNDNGATWITSAPIRQGQYITALTIFKNRIYTGMDEDVYSTGDNGKTWTDEGSLAAAVTSFAIWNNELYCSSYYNGILTLNGNTNKWQSFSNGLTSVFDFDHIATKVLVGGSDLFAATGISFATFNTAQQLWIHKNYFNNNVHTNTFWSDYVIDMTYNQGSLLGQVYIEFSNQQTILRSDDQGLTWYADTAKLRTDINKYTIHGLLAGSNKYYSIANQDTLSIGTWIQQRDLSAPAGSTWANGEEFLPAVRSAAIREHNGVLYLATSGGLYFKKASSGNK